MKVILAQIIDFVAPSKQLKTMQLITRDSALSERKIKLFGKEVLQPRLIGFQGDKNVKYTYSGKMLMADSWSPEIIQLREQLYRLLEIDFNSCLINYYRNGKDSMGWHSDDEKELGREPTIASISFGEDRPLLFKGKKGISVQPFSIGQPSGSLLIMAGQCQKVLLHSISKKKSSQARLNLTFRTVST